MKTTFESESERDEEILSLFLYKSPKRLPHLHDNAEIAFFMGYRPYGILNDTPKEAERLNLKYCTWRKFGCDIMYVPKFDKDMDALMDAIQFYLDFHKANNFIEKNWEIDYLNCFEELVTATQKLDRKKMFSSLVFLIREYHIYKNIL